MDYQLEMVYRESNGHVTDNVTWPRKVKLVIPIRLEHNISKMAGDWDSVPKDFKLVTGVSHQIE